jgi:DNA-binding beta-propeller fold protein YncE
LEIEMTIRRTMLNAALPLSLLITPAYAANKTTADYRITKTVALGSGERWDFVVFDPVGKRVYVAHGDHVTAVDEPDGKVIGQIGTFPGAPTESQFRPPQTKATRTTVRLAPLLHLVSTRLSP